MQAKIIKASIYVADVWDQLDDEADFANDGFEQSDIDDLRRLIADTNITLLAITMLASALHLLFESLKI